MSGTVCRRLLWILVLSCCTTSPQQVEAVLLNTPRPSRCWPSKAMQERWRLLHASSTSSRPMTWCQEICSSEYLKPMAIAKLHCTDNPVSLPFSWIWCESRHWGIKCKVWHFSVGAWSTTRVSLSLVLFYVFLQAIVDEVSQRLEATGITGSLTRVRHESGELKWAPAGNRINGEMACVCRWHLHTHWE